MDHYRDAVNAPISIVIFQRVSECQGDEGSLGKTGIILDIPALPCIFSFLFLDQFI